MIRSLRIYNRHGYLCRYRSSVTLSMDLLRHGDEILEGLKYQLAETYICQTPIIGERIEDDFFTLQRMALIVNKGFCLGRCLRPNL